MPPMGSPATVGVTAKEDYSSSLLSNFVTIDDLPSKSVFIGLLATASANEVQDLENHFYETSEPDSNPDNDVAEDFLSFTDLSSARVTYLGFKGNEPHNFDKEKVATKADKVPVGYKDDFIPNCLHKSLD